MLTLLQKVRSGVRAGTALWLAGAGCSDSVTRPVTEIDASSDANTMVADSARDANTVLDAAADANVIGDAARDADIPTLRPYQLSALACDGPGGTIGCCRSAYCYTPSGACPAADALLSIAPVGSPACGVTGPFAPNPEDLNAASGNCCYIVGSQFIEGRPLFVDHNMLVAPIVTRTDWLLG